MAEKLSKSPDNHLDVTTERNQALGKAVFRASNAVVYFDSDTSIIDPMIAYMSVHHPELQTTVIDMSVISTIEQLEQSLDIVRDEDGYIEDESINTLEENYLILRHFGKFVISRTDNSDFNENSNIFSLLGQVVRHARVMFTYDDGVMNGENDKVWSIARGYNSLDSMLRDHAVNDIIT